MSYKTINISNYPKLQLSQIGKKINPLSSYGLNSFGALGLSDTINRSTPTIASSFSNLWKKISTGNFNHTLAIQTNNTLWVCGNNSYGQLGLSDVNHRSTFTQIGTLSNWAQISCGSFFSLAIQSNGTLWAWGRNESGQLGLSDLTNRSSPTQVGSLSVWTQISCGIDFFLAIQSNGTLWSCGYGIYGNLGLNNQLSRSSPTQSGNSLSTWSQISAGSEFSLALQSDGTLWSTGNNNSGQLGLNTSGSRVIFNQIGNLSNWTQMAAGYGHSLALQSNGTLWTWGNNSFGLLGLSDFTNRSSPVQVGNLSNWTQIAVGSYHSLALQSYGNLWVWGNNSWGQLGLSNQVSTFSPIQTTTYNVNLLDGGLYTTFFTNTRYV
jgi:alpha-tubulin suppressor-like RCC1 family protein